MEGGGEKEEEIDERKERVGRGGGQEKGNLKLNYWESSGGKGSEGIRNKKRTTVCKLTS